MVQGKINRGRHIDHLAGRHSIQTNQGPPPSSPHHPCLSINTQECSNYHLITAEPSFIHHKTINYIN